MLSGRAPSVHTIAARALRLRPLEILFGPTPWFLRALEIIEYFKPMYRFIENPQTGLLKSRPFMLDLPYTDVDYCRYSDWGYKKRTRIWTNSGYQGRLCLGVGGCASMEGRRHRTSAQRGGRMFQGQCDKQHNSQQQLYRIPDELCSSVAMHMNISIADGGVRG